MQRAAAEIGRRTREKSGIAPGFILQALIHNTTTRWQDRDLRAKRQQWSVHNFGAVRCLNPGHLSQIPFDRGVKQYEGYTNRMWYLYFFEWQLLHEYFVSVLTERPARRRMRIPHLCPQA